MSRSIKPHRRPDHLLCINIRQKLHLNQYQPTDCPTCLCGKTIDPHAMHTFCCHRISKIAIHHRVRDGIAQPIHTVSAAAGIFSKSSKMCIELQGLIPHHPNLRPLDLSWCPAGVPTITNLLTSVQTFIQPCQPILRTCSKRRGLSSVAKGLLATLPHLALLETRSYASCTSPTEFWSPWPSLLMATGVPCSTLSCLDTPTAVISPYHPSHSQLPPPLLLACTTAPCLMNAPPA